MCIRDSPQVAHRELIRTLEHPKSGSVRVVGPGWRIKDTETEMQPPPLLNQHMDEVLEGWLGWSNDQINEFRKEVGQDG